MEATANACALISAADGEIKSEEEAEDGRLHQQFPELKVFNLSDVIAVFNDACGKFEFDFQIGRPRR